MSVRTDGTGCASYCGAFQSLRFPSSGDQNKNIPSVNKFNHTPTQRIPIQIAHHPRNHTVHSIEPPWIHIFPRILSTHKADFEVRSVIHQNKFRNTIGRFSNKILGRPKQGGIAQTNGAIWRWNIHGWRQIIGILGGGGKSAQPTIFMRLVKKESVGARTSYRTRFLRDRHKRAGVLVERILMRVRWNLRCCALYFCNYAALEKFYFINQA